MRWIAAVCRWYRGSDTFLHLRCVIPDGGCVVEVSPGVAVGDVVVGDWVVVGDVDGDPVLDVTALASSVLRWSISSANW